MLSDEISDWKNKHDIMEKDHREAKLSQFLAEKELEKCKQLLGELAEQAEKLGKDNKLYRKELEVYKEREKTTLTKYEKLLADYKMLERENREKVVFYEERVKRERIKYDKLLENFQRLERQKKEKVVFYEEREKREGIKYEKLLEDFERLERESRELVMKNSELCSDRAKTERQLESVRKREEELNLRFTHLEENVEALMSQQILQSKVVKEDSMDFTNENGDLMNTQNGNLTEAKVKEATLNGHEKGNSSHQLKEAGDMLLDEQPTQSTQMVQSEIIGMEFDTIELVNEFWNQYGRKTGFGGRIHYTNRSRKDSKMVLGRVYVCSREGVKVKDKRRVNSKPRLESRCHCPVKMAASLDKKKGKFVVKFFQGNHNHELMSASFVNHSCDKRQKPYTTGGNFKSGVVVEISDSNNEMTLPTHNQIPNHLATATGSKRKMGLFLDFEQRENDCDTTGFILPSINT